MMKTPYCISAQGRGSAGTKSRRKGTRISHRGKFSILNKTYYTMLFSLFYCSDDDVLVASTFIFFFWEAYFSYCPSQPFSPAYFAF